MNPYDHRAVEAVWERVAPGKQVLSRQATGGKPPQDNVRQVHDMLMTLARGYDCLAAQKRAPVLRQMAAQCRRDADHLGLREQASMPTQRTLEAELAQKLTDMQTTQAPALLCQSRERLQTLNRMR